MLIFNSTKNNAIDALEILLKGDLNWSVSKEKLQTSSGIETDHVAIVREDQKTILGVHKSGYEVFQNQQLAELILDLSQQSGAPIHSVGHLKGGAKVYIQLKGTNLRLGDDMVEGFHTIVNSFDGSTSLGCGTSTKTISCQNTFFAAYRELDAKIKHTKGMQVKIDDLLRAIDTFRKEEASNFDLIRKLASQPYTLSAVDSVFKVMFDTTFDTAAANAKAKAADRTLSTKKTNLIETFTADLKDQINEKGQTLWGLFSGVTKYTTHHIGSDSAETKMFGSVAKNERLILSKLAELVK